MTRSTRTRKTTSRAKSARTTQKKSSTTTQVPQPASLREVWLAGLGAAAATSEAATGLFDLLVEKGKEAEPRVAAAAESTVAGAREKATRAAEEVGATAKTAVESAMRQLGVSARARNKNLFHRLGDLAEAIL